MKGHKSFVLYADYKEHIDMLSVKEKADLLDAIFAHVCGTKEPVLEGMAKMAFSFIRSGLDRDAEKYADICSKRQKAANERWQKEMQMHANVSKSMVCSDLHYDTGTVNDIDTVNDTDTVTEADNMPMPPRIPTLEQVENYYIAFCTEYGYEYRNGFSERFITYKHPSDWERDLEIWVKQDEKDKQKRNYPKSYQNFIPSETKWNEIAAQIMQQDQMKGNNDG